mmetsp:Transcript_9074/g.23214  ORF Transcript_9074/g.23214 Transcript_9074/m.23214 type:complete len:217 (-) Transcript_9074:1154-1804(-)
MLHLPGDQPPAVLHPAVQEHVHRVSRPREVAPEVGVRGAPPVAGVVQGLLCRLAGPPPPLCHGASVAEHFWVPPGYTPLPHQLLRTGGLQGERRLWRPAGAPEAGRPPARAAAGAGGAGAHHVAAAILPCQHALLSAHLHPPADLLHRQRARQRQPCGWAAHVVQGRAAGQPGRQAGAAAGQRRRGGRQDVACSGMGRARDGDQAERAGATARGCG